MQIGQGDARMSVLILYFLGHGEAGDHPGDCGAVKWQGWPRVGWAGCVLSPESLHLPEGVLV